MIRLLKIEWLKLRGYRAFWILAGLYALSLTGVLVGTKLFVDMVAEKGGDLGRIAVEFVPMLFKFPDIWPNLAYIAGYLNVIPAFLMVIVTGNEFSFRTARQNVIDGMTRGEFLASKLLAAGALAVVSTLLFSLIVVLMGTMSGGGSSPIMGIEAAGYLFLKLYIFLVFCVFVVIVIRKSALSVYFILVYSILLEPLLAFFISRHADTLHTYLPITSINRLVPNAFLGYLPPPADFARTTTAADLAVALVYFILFVAGGYLLLRRRDL